MKIEMEAEVWGAEYRAEPTEIVLASPNYGDFNMYGCKGCAGDFNNPLCTALPTCFADDRDGQAVVWVKKEDK